GLHRSLFEQRGISFDEHVKREHNIWHYVYFVIYLMLKPDSHLTGPESYIRERLETRTMEQLTNAEDSEESSRVTQLIAQLEKTSEQLKEIECRIETMSEQVSSATH
ncbi:unnamed protein product, partial [Echinostoma caproni]|uniref:DUF1041 domain-containing protein n=1 Tax=Echinostoma caproni TaxID=27848 RepID=A0A183B2H2_9TREM